MRNALFSFCTRAAVAGLISLAFAGATPAGADERLRFPVRDNIKNEIVQHINNETVRVDIAVWYLTEREITTALLNRYRAGVPVRVLGDRVSIFEIDPLTRREFEYLATNGVPIRLRYNPTSFPYIMHWKCGIFVGQDTLEFGSANWTPFELRAASATNYKDETVLFTDDTALVNAFKTNFDVFWADTQLFLDWPAAYQRETGQTWTAPMTVDRTRLEPNHPSPSTMVWSQGNDLNARMTTEINRETQGVDIVLYRLSVPNITNALIGRLNAGVPVRVFVEPSQYRQSSWPEYWLTGARVDQLWVAGAQIKERTHQGLTHMKVLITSLFGMQGSSNFTKNWQRDHNYFIPAAQKPVLYQTLRDEFDRMWDNTTFYRNFYPKPPATPSLAAPADGLAGVSLTPRLEWNRAPWAVSYDVYLGTSPSNLLFQARVNAQLVEEPPMTYSWTAPAALLPNTIYHWRVVARTFATDVDPALVANSTIRDFLTRDSGGGPPVSTPYGGTPWALPGTVQAENFDEGGQTVAYADATAGNSGGRYRTTDVDIENTADTGGGYNVGWMSPAEWLKYTVNVAAAGQYDIELRAAANGTGGVFHIEMNGANVTGSMSLPNTGGWQRWTTLARTNITLNAGQQVLRLVVDSAGPTGVTGNVNWIRVVPRGAGGGPAPYGGAPAPLPGTLQAENFDEGGAGVGYQDATEGNQGGQYRSTDVDIEATGDAGGGYNVMSTSASEWLQYTVSVAAAGSYDIDLRVASSEAGARLHVEANGANLTGPITVPDTGDDQAWTTVTVPGVTLAGGQQVWRVVYDATGPSGSAGNLNYLAVRATAPPAVPEIVIYADDVQVADVYGNWTHANDPAAAVGIKLSSADVGENNANAPLASPPNYFEVTFNAQAGVRYRLWLRLSALNANKFNDAVWVQFDQSINASGGPIYRIGTTQGLLVNMATCSTCVPSGWGWQNRAYWLSDTGEVRFATSGPQRLRIQIREDGVAVDQIVISPQLFLSAVPGPAINDSTIVPKP